MVSGATEFNSLQSSSPSLQASNREEPSRANGKRWLKCMSLPRTSLILDENWLTSSSSMEWVIPSALPWIFFTIDGGVQMDDVHVSNLAADSRTDLIRFLMVIKTSFYLWRPVQFCGCHVKNLKKFNVICLKCNFNWTQWWQFADAQCVYWNLDALKQLYTGIAIGGLRSQTPEFMKIISHRHETKDKGNLFRHYSIAAYVWVWLQFADGTQ